MCEKVQSSLQTDLFIYLPKLDISLFVYAVLVVPRFWLIVQSSRGEK